MPTINANEDNRPTRDKGVPVMEAMDYVEQQAQANGRMRLEAVGLLSKRAHELTLLLLGGAGGLGAYGLGKLGEPMVAAPFLAAAAWAFALGGVVALKCLRARTIWPLHNTPAVLWTAWQECMSEMQGDEALAMDHLRKRELSRLDEAIKSIDGVNAELAKWLNRGYAGAALLPVPAALGGMLAWWLR